jgi:hypothetical protein
MHGTKETFVISFGVWLIAGFLSYGLVFAEKGVLPWNAEDGGKDKAQKAQGQWRWGVLIFFLCFFVTSSFLYSHGFSGTSGIWHSWATYWNYETTMGHEKPWYHYLELLFWPKKSAGHWWQESSLALVLMVGGIMAVRYWRKGKNSFCFWAMFWWWSALGHMLAYSLISYKTPWLMVVPVLHMAMVAGFVIKDLEGRWRGLNVRTLAWIPLLIILILGFSQFQQSRMAVFRLANDIRYPYAYVPSSKDALRLKQTIEGLSKMAKWNVDAPIAVVGREIWPIPWLLRGEKVGYWKRSEDLDGAGPIDVVIALGDETEAINERYGETHTYMMIGLRNEVPMVCYIRQQLFDDWVDSK